jgi:hypothetical protein
MIIIRMILMMISIKRKDDDNDDDKGGDEVDIISDNLQWLQHHDFLMIIYSQIRPLLGRQVSENFCVVYFVCVH